MRRLVLGTSCFLLVLFFSVRVSAQKQNNIWYFGTKAGLDFNSQPPGPLTSNLETLEGLEGVSPYSFYRDTAHAISLPADTTLCQGQSLELYIDTPVEECAAGLVWNNGSTDPSQNIGFPGTYWVEVQSTCQQYRDSITVQFEACSQQGCIREYGPYFEIPGKSLHGYSLAARRENDGFYLGGLLNDSALLVRYDLSGKVLWARTFDVVSGKADHISAVLLDSDGMLAVSGTAGEIDNTNGGPIFVFRYDPENDQVLWTMEFVTAVTRNFNWTIIEKSPGGNYIISNLPVDDPGSNVNLELFELNRNTGTVMPGIFKNLDLGSSEEITSMLMYEGFLYGTGRFSLGAAPSSFRQALIKIDPVDGSIVWSKVGHRPGNVSARLYGADLLIDQDIIYHCFFGDPGGTSTTNTDLFVQKTNLDGNISWVKQYQLPGSNDWGYEIIKSGDGMVILAAQRALPYAYVLFKIDFDGNVLWAREFPLANPFYTAHPLIGDNQLIEVGGQLVWTGYEVTSDTEAKLMVIRTDLNGNKPGLCGEYGPVNIPMSTVTNPVFFDVDMIEAEPEFSVQKITLSSREAFLPYDLNCISSDTIFFTFSDTICSGEAYEGYTETGVYEDYFVTPEGCDSLRILELTVQDHIVSDIEKTICKGGSFEGYEQTGIYRDTFPMSTQCDSIRNLALRTINCQEVVWYDLNACSSFMSNGSHMDYSEFVPAYPNPLPCGLIDASNVFRDPPQMNKHSCTQGVNNSIAMCISSNASCMYLPGDAASLIMELNIIPAEDSVIQISGLNFYERAPATYSWISGPGGPNNYPKYYGIRVLKNGTEIFRRKDVPTSLVWSAQTYDWVDMEAFRITAPALIRIELLPYCPIGNGATVSAWDVDEITIAAGCWPSHIPQPQIAGVVTTMDDRRMRNVEIEWSSSPDFRNSDSVLTDEHGEYQMANLVTGNSYYIRGSYNDAWLNGVNTLDLLSIQKHLLGLEPFTRPDQFIAADINHNTTITVTDLLELRKALLGKTSSFPQNTSWRIGWFDDNSTWGEIQSTNPAYHDIMINWKGIKIGDLNNDAVLLAPGELFQIRTEENFELEYPDQEVVEGDEIEVTLKNVTETDLEGFQFILEADGLVLTDVRGISIQLSEEHYQRHRNNVVWFSWSEATATHLDSLDELFSLKLAAKRRGRLSEMLSILDNPLQPQAYLNRKIAGLRLKKQASNSFSGEAIGNITIHPNPFEESTIIELEMKQPGKVQFDFYNFSGQHMHSEEKVWPKGQHQLEISRKQLGPASGIIMCRMVCQTQAITTKLAMIH